MTTPAGAAVEIRTFQVTIPAGTAQSAPVTTDIAFPSRVVQAVTWKVPPGPSGLMGWRLTMSGGNAVLPTGGGWVVADDQSDTWPVTNQPDSGAWEVTGYNTDIYDHSVYLTFQLALVPAPGSSVTLAPLSSLQAVPDAAAVTPASVAGS